MTLRTEGTIVLEGLVEGLIPPLPGSEDKLRQWVSAVRKMGLKFSLDTDGSRFSLLAIETPAPAGGLQPDAAETIHNALNEMLKIFPPDKRREVFSTLRSREYGRGIETQTLYFVTGEGRFEKKQREIEADTETPETPPSVRHRVLFGLAGLGIVAVVVAATSLFIPYRQIFGRLAGELRPIDPATLHVEAGAYAEFFTVESVARMERGRGYVVTLRRTPAYPVTPGAMSDLLARSQGRYPDALVADALARGYIRAETVYDLGSKKGEAVTYRDIRIRNLRAEETLDIRFPIPQGPPPVRIELTF